MRLGRNVIYPITSNRQDTVRRSAYIWLIRRATKQFLMRVERVRMSTLSSELLRYLHSILHCCAYIARKSASSCGNVYLKWRIGIKIQKRMRGPLTYACGLGFSIEKKDAIIPYPQSGKLLSTPNKSSC